MKSEDSLSSILLTSRLVSSEHQPLKAAEYWRLCDRIGRTGALLGRSEAQLTDGLGLDPDLARRIVGLIGRATAMAFELDRLDQSGVSTLTPFDEDFPRRLVERLGATAPPLLHVAGELDLLRRPGLGVVGSRDVSPDGAEIAQAAAERGAGLGLPLVSGGARGVDQLAMHAAHRVGGSVIGVLADSLLRTLKSPDVRRVLQGGSTVMCTPYGPDAPFSAGNAMGRNKLVYAHSLVTLVVASDVDKGGTWAGAVEALRNRMGRVAVWRGAGEGPGNRLLQEQGAVAVESIDDLDELLLDEEPTSAPRSVVAQASLSSPTRCRPVSPSG